MKAVAAIVIGAGVIGACAQAPKAAAPTKPGPVKTAPVTYYTAHCQRCHGPSGSYYADGFAKKKTDDELKKVIASMAAGPGGAPLDEPGLAAQMVLHRAFDGGSPFLSWTSRKGLILEGEVNAADKVTAAAGAKKISVTVTDDRWKLTLPSEKDLESLKITAESGSKRVVLTPSQSATSTSTSTSKKAEP